MKSGFEQVRGVFDSSRLTSHIAKLVIAEVTPSTMAEEILDESAEVKYAMTVFILIYGRC